MRKFLDTNILLEKKHLKFFKYNNEKFVISSQTLIELENIKRSCRDEELKYKARYTCRFLSKNRDLYDVSIVTNEHYNIIDSHGLEVTPDTLIIASAKTYKDCIFITNDILCKMFAEDIFKIEVSDIEVECDNLYKGFKIVQLSDEELADFYTNLNVNKFNCLNNEYIMIKDKNGEIIDKYRWSGTAYTPLSYRQINSTFVGKVKPKNNEQELAFDLLQNSDIKVKVLRGRAGSGKDYLMASTALSLLGKKGLERIIWIRNNIEVKNSKEIGFLPGTKDEKLMPFVMPFADHVGGEFGINQLVSQGKVVIEHFGLIRGRDFKNSIIICSEAENMTREHIQLLVSRVSEGSELWINGDINQIDSFIFENSNALVSVVDRLKGENLFGCVELQKVERSEVAKLADLLG